ncbi:MAG: heparan-alpha-glucosaminide N-acetyltransferase domain-containing protein [Lentimicrobium sp.]|jgi:uncharacterized membrane protein|nr:heparan-alpha-glucosaminide N-acetyltransferase domain-containing protein [Lentimicrobium sp.]
MPNSRFLLPDLLKGLAVLFMVQVHITELFATERFYLSIPGKISLFLGGVPAAPLFMVLMGFFIGFRTLKTGPIMFRGLKLIAGGFLLNFGINFHLFYRIFTGKIDLNPLPYFFGVDILFLAGLSLMVLAIIKWLFREQYIYSLILAVVIPALSLFLPVYHGDSMTLNYFLPYLYSDAWWSYFPLIPWLAYPLLGFGVGIIIKKYPDIIKRRVTDPNIFLLIVLLVLLFLHYGFRISSNLAAYYHHGLSFFAWAAVFLLFLVLSAHYYLKAIKKQYPVIHFIAWIGKNVTVFYVFQWLIIGNVATAIYQTQPTTSLPLWFLGITLITALLVKGWEERKKIVRLFE